MGTGGRRFGAGRPGYRLESEAAHRLDIRDWRRRGFLRAGSWFNWQWKRNGEPSGSIGVRVEADHARLSYSVSVGDSWRDASQTVRLVTTPCRYGGSRAWYECPVCWRRACVLYLRSGRFACRTCQRICYRSQNGSEIDRVCARFHRLAALFEMGKPKWQRWATFNRLIDRYVEADERMNRALGGMLLKLGMRP